MRATQPGRFLRAGAALCLSSATLLGAGMAPPPAIPDEEVERSGDVFTPLLEKRLKSGAGLDEIVVDVRWPDGGKMAASRVYGSGVGIWNREVQFRLPRSEVTSLLRAVVKDRFGSLPTTVGEVEEGPEGGQKGHVTISIGAVTKTVVQVESGTQSRELQDLAQRFLEASRKAASRGIRASSFADAFDELASGKLAPEALEVIVQRNEVRNPSSSPADRWVMRVEGRRVEDRDRGPARQAPPARVLVLSKGDFEKLVGLLRESDPSALPQSLYSERLTEVVIQVLKQRRHIQARPFAGMTAATNGEKQKSFDRLIEGLVALHERVRRDGRLVETADLTSETENEREGKGDGEKKSREKPKASAPARPTPSSPAER
jgi:hypothetical protein